MNIDNFYPITTFKMNYVKPESWNKEVLKALKNSTLVKEIEFKYPEASANYFFFKHHPDQSDKNSIEKILSTILFDIKLDKGKIWHYQVDGKSENNINKQLINDIGNIMLTDVEQDIKKGIERHYNNKSSAEDCEKSLKLFFNKILNLIFNKLH